MHSPFNVTTQALNDQDHASYKSSHQRLKKLAELPDKVAALYDVVHRALGPGLMTHADRLILSLSVPLNMKHLIIGTNSLYRLYASQMFREVRSAVEATGIAWLIRNDQHKYKIFVDDGKGDQASRAKAKQAFKSYIIFPKSQPLLVRLNGHYDSASMRAHTTFRGFFNHLLLPQGSPTTEFSMCDLQPDQNPTALPNSLIWMCMAHMDIVETVVKLIFAKEFDNSNAAFINLSLEIYEQIQAHAS